MKIHELFSSAATWIRESYAGKKNNTGKKIPTGIEDPAATCFCLTGAARICYPNEKEREQVILKLAEEIEKRNPEIGKHNGILITSATPYQRAFAICLRWNDYKASNWKSVRNLARRLDV